MIILAAPTPSGRVSAGAERAGCDGSREDLEPERFSVTALAKLRALWFWMVDLCVPPELRADAQLARRQRTTAGYAYLAMAFVALFGVLARQTFPGPFGDLLCGLFLGTIPVVLLAMFLLRDTGRVALPVNLVMVYVYGIFCASAYHLGGPRAPTLAWMMVLATIALFALGRRAALVWMGMGLAAFAAFLTAYQLGHEFVLEGTPTQRARYWCSSASGLTFFMLLTVFTFERARRRAMGTLETTNLELEQARDRADAASRGKTAFLANMSHEIRTPLTAVLGFTELAVDRAPQAGPAELDALETIRRNGHHLLRIVNEMLDLSKIESGQFEIQPSRFSVVELVSEVLTLLRTQAEAKGCTLVAEYVDAVPESIEADPARLQQVLINLVSNAIKFSADGAVRVRIGTVAHAEMDRVRFQVVDSGIGMTPAQLGRIFTPFMQADVATTRLYGGTGLGLSISRVLIERMGGAIEVESAPGVGSTFTVDLPVGTREPVRMLASAEAIGVIRPPRAKPTLALRCRVLIVDDNPDNRRLIGYFLRDAGADVHAVESGARALEVWQELAPDLLLMDIQMPHMDGYATTRALRERGCEASIVALTAHAMAADRERCLMSGFDGYASKPIDRRRLIDLVDHHLRAERARAAPSEVAERENAGPTRRPLAFWERAAAWLLPPEQREQPNEIQRARTILWVTLAPLPFVPLQALAVWKILPPGVRAWAVGIVLLAIPLALGVLSIFRLTRSTAVAANTLLAYAFVAIATVTYWTGGPPSLAAFWLVVIPMVAVSLVGSAHALVWALAAVVHHAAFLIALRAGYEFPPLSQGPWTGIGALVSLSGMLCAVMLLQFAYERARSDALETLAALNRSLAEARAQAERANRAKSSFLTNVSHELRTPMTAILGFADMLLDDWRERSGLEEASSLVATVRTSARQLLALINDLLDLSKVEAGHLAVESIAFAPAAILHEVVESARAAADAKGLALALAEDAPLPRMLYGDPVRVSQILGKLLDNAIKFTERGRIDVRACLQESGADAKLVILVQDTGSGIPAEALPALFGSFHQVDASMTREHGGTGLGLALCQRLVVALGGTITVDSEVGRGSAFRAVLPASESAVCSAVDASKSAPLEPLEALILLAEDAPDSQRLIAELLRRAGAEVEVANNGAIALEKVRAAAALSRPYDALVLDMQMPVLDGASTARALRAEGHALPILALTAEASPEERERCLAAGCDDYATKPVERATLIGALHALLRDKDGSGST